MKWFKHISDSLNDPDVSTLISEFKGDGYLVFFGIIELMAREFDIENPGISSFSYSYLKKNLQLSGKKISKVLHFLENNQKKIRFIILKDDGINITLNCPKLKELCDEFTQKLLKKKSGLNRDLLLPKEEEVEEDKEKNSIGRVLKEIPPDKKKILVNEFGEKIILDYIERVKLTELSKNKKYSDWDSTIRLWMKQDGVEPIEKEKPKPPSPRYDVETYCKHLKESNPELQKWFQREILKPVSHETNKQSYHTWFKPLIAIEVKNQVLYLHAPKGDFVSWIKDNYSQLFNDVLKEMREKITDKNNINKIPKKIVITAHVPEKYRMEADNGTE